MISNSTFIEITSEVDAIKTTIEAKTDAIAVKLAKELVNNTLTVADINKMLARTTPDIAISILTKALAITSKLVHASKSDSSDNDGKIPKWASKRDFK